MPGPLTGVRVVELPNIGPVQFAGMLLADMGADVLRLDRATDVASGSNVAGFVSPYSVIDRGRRSAGIDLKHPDAAEVVLRLCEHADVLLEGFRPGVAERLGVGPAACRARNDRLVYARMTGWGQDGPLADDVGHDINYLSLAGVLWHIGPEGHRAGPADQLARRLRRRRRARRDGHPRRARRTGDIRAGADRRRRHGRRQRAAHEHLLRHRRDARLGRPRHQHPRRRRALLQRVRDGRRSVRVDRVVRAEVLCQPAPPPGARRPRPRAADGPCPVAAAQAALRSNLRDAHA